MLINSTVIIMMKANFKLVTISKLYSKSLDVVGIRVHDHRAFVTASTTLSKANSTDEEEKKTEAYEKVAEAAAAVKEGAVNLSKTCNIVKDSVKTVTKNVAGKATETLVDKATEKIKETITSSK